MTSRVRRCASQRSTHAKTICINSRLKAAKASNTSRAQGSREGFANPTPCQNSAAPQAAHDGRRVERSISQSHQKVERIAERKTQQIGGIGIVGKGGGHNGENLPENKHRPQQRAQATQACLRRDKKYAPTHMPKAPPNPAMAKANRHDDSRESTPAAPRVLRRALTKSCQRNHRDCAAS